MSSATAQGAREARVIVSSTSAAAGTAADRTGPSIVQWLSDRGFSTPPAAVVADGDPVGAAVRAAIDSEVAIVLTTGGTGISPTDNTPEQVGPLLEVQLPGLIESLRARGAAVTPNAALTRGVAGFAGETFIMTLPGSPGGVRDGLAVLAEVLEHMLGQRSGTPRGQHSAR
ncbi:MogA/MoaB family molybdenum cofactor biosynthesis protein [Leucobacter sp. cx-42]|uniref:MogA/MoaB family molybdenum cofactor biosynthesis protein n=1 Tax=unclassified Leucobacter TaxID=2621730 RepID=UPI00165E4128|nr:MogA/MoaB family molybdenum cofactor biosynthesis protein [Leucobacter sp. cx-42]